MIISSDRRTANEQSGRTETAAAHKQIYNVEHTGVVAAFSKALWCHMLIPTAKQTKTANYIQLDTLSYS